MTEAFLKIVNMSISAGWLVLAVLVLRFILKKAPRWIHVLLWGIVAVRLICPFSIESALSLIPSAETISPEIMMDPTPMVATGIPALNSALNPVISDSFAPNPGDSANPLQIWIPVASAVWAVGAAAMLAYALISYMRLKKRVSTAFPIGKNIRQSEFVDSPFVLGLFRPVIYLPFRLDSADMEPVIAHELTHIRRKDHWWKPLGYTLLAVYWFNPLMWIAYILLCRDIELACDERVIAGLDSESRADYTQALVACAVNRRTIAACPLAFGEVGVKERVKSIMNYRKPGFWVIVLALILCAVLAVSMLTDPISENTPADIFSTLELEDVQWAQMTVWNTPAGEHIMLDKAQIEELVVILKSLDAKDFKEKQGVHGVSVMVNCGEQEILIQTADEYAFFSFNAETAKILGDINWSIRSEDLAAWVESIAYPGAADATQWVDLVNPEAIWEIGTREITIPDFPEVTFRWTAGEITANEKVLIQGMPVWNAYFADLTGDGKPEICAYVSYGSGMIDTHVVVYDYVNGQEYTLWDRGYYDYSLSLENGVLVCRKFRYPSSTPFDQTGALMVGRLMLTDAGGGEGKRLVIDTLDEKTGISDIVDRSVTEGLPTDEALEPFWEDESYIYSFPSIRSHLVMVIYNNGNSEDIKTALENGRASISDLDRFGIQYYAEPKANLLEDAISQVILEHFAGDDPDGLIHAESHAVLANETDHLNDKPAQVRFFLLVHHVKYSTYGGTLEAVGGSYVPTAITFNITDSGDYVLQEYWEPRDGGLYVDDIRDKFPESAAEAALNDQAYIEALKAETYRKAQAYLSGTMGLDERIGELLKEIQSSPLYSSNPGDYILAHMEAFEELVGYGEYTLRYCFTEFLKGGQHGLNGHIMAAACAEVMAAWDEEYSLNTEPVTGQDWFDYFCATAEDLAVHQGPEVLQKHYPGAFVLLTMTDESLEIKN